MRLTIAENGHVLFHLCWSAGLSGLSFRERLTAAHTSSIKLAIDQQIAFCARGRNRKPV